MNDFASTFRRDFGGIIISALIFMVSFLWKDFLRDIEQVYFPDQQGLFGRFVYVLLVSLSVIVFVIILRRILALGRNQDLHNFDDIPERPDSDDSTGDD